jgi:hypothetical protein
MVKFQCFALAALHAPALSPLPDDTLLELASNFGFEESRGMLLREVSDTRTSPSPFSRHFWYRTEPISDCLKERPGAKIGLLTAYGRA